MRAAQPGLPPLILASGSPRRRDLLRQMGYEFQVVPAEATELHHEQMTAQEAAQINAYRKARSVAKRHADALVIGADTLVGVETRILGKPSNLEEAYGMLEQLQGKTHVVVTAVCLLCLRQHRQRMFAELTEVRFKPLDAPAIRRYLNVVNPLDKAGAYAIQEQGELLVEQVSGSYTNVIGMPTERFQYEISQWASESPPVSPLPFIASVHRDLPGRGTPPPAP